MPAPVPSTRRRRRRRAVRRRRRHHVRRPAELAERVRLPPRPVGHACAASSTASSIAARTRSALRPGRRRGSACARCPTARSRRGWCATSGRATASRCSRRAALHARRRRRRPPRADRRRLGDHAGAVDRRRRCSPTRPARVTVLYGNRRTDTVMFADELADLKDRDAGAGRAGPRAVARAARARAVQRPSRRRQAAPAAAGAVAGRRRRPLVAVRTVRDGRRRPAGPRRARRAGRPRAPRAVLRRGHGAAARRARRAADRRGDERRDDRPRRPAHDGRRCAGDVSILDGAQRVRPDLPFACKGGVCGTCRARSSPATVDLRRNFALDPAELAAGFVLTCQSYATRGDVTVDFDT